MIRNILELTRRAGSTEGAMSFPGEHKMFYENDQKVTFHRITYGPSALHMAHHFKSGPPLVCFGCVFFKSSHRLGYAQNRGPKAELL